MQLYSESKNYKLFEGNMLDMLDVIEPNSIDAIVTDPPYELNFMNKGWDNSGIAFQKETWQKCYSVLKSGGYLLAFGGSRTFHRIACAIEDAGFEIRDTIMWLYGSGFPKSLNIGFAIDKKNGVDKRTGNIRMDGVATNSGSGCYNCNVSGENSMQSSFEERIAQNEWTGWGTTLKPAYEPIIVARKPCEGSCIDNVLKYGVGGINIDECRVEPTGEKLGRNNHVNTYGGVALLASNSKGLDQSEKPDNGRFPSNVILTYDETDFDEVCGGMPKYTVSSGGSGEASTTGNFKNVYGEYKGTDHIANLGGLGDSGSAARYFKNCPYTEEDNDIWDYLPDAKPARYFYCAKASSDDRHSGGITNNHPTVKNCELMRYLVRLVTPKGGTILDPFNGSGSTGKAIMYENRDRDADYKYIGIELSEEYLAISDARIQAANKKVAQIKLW